MFMCLGSGSCRPSTALASARSPNLKLETNSGVGGILLLPPGPVGSPSLNPEPPGSPYAGKRKLVEGEDGRFVKMPKMEVKEEEEEEEEEEGLLSERTDRGDDDFAAALGMSGRPFFTIAFAGCAKWFTLKYFEVLE